MLRILALLLLSTLAMASSPHPMECFRHFMADKLYRTYFFSRDLQDYRGVVNSIERQGGIVIRADLSTSAIYFTSPSKPVIAGTLVEEVG